MKHQSGLASPSIAATLPPVTRTRDDSARVFGSGGVFMHAGLPLPGAKAVIDILTRGMEPNDEALNHPASSLLSISRTIFQSPRSRFTMNSDLPLLRIGLPPAFGVAVSA